MSFTINIYYKGQNGFARKFAQEMISSGIVDEIRNKEGNLRYEYFEPLDDEETILLIDSWMMKITVALFAGCCIAFLLMHKEFVYNTVHEVCVIENTFIFTTLRPTTITCDFKEIIRVEDFILFTGKKISLTDKRKLYICNEIFKPKIIKDGADFTNHMEYLFYDK